VRSYSRTHYKRGERVSHLRLCISDRLGLRSVVSPDHYDYLRVELKMIALLQYNLISRCLLLNRTWNVYRHVRLSWQNQCRGEM